MTDLWDSKKFKAALLAAVIAGIATYFGLTTEQVAAIIAPLLAFIVGQGIADAGKEKAKVERGE